MHAVDAPVPTNWVRDRRTNEQVSESSALAEDRRCEGPQRRCFPNGIACQRSCRPRTSSKSHAALNRKFRGEPISFSPFRSGDRSVLAMYYRALKLGPASVWQPIDKLSVVLWLFRVAFIGERLRRATGWAWSWSHWEPSSPPPRLTIIMTAFDPKRTLGMPSRYSYGLTPAKVIAVSNQTDGCHP